LYDQPELPFISIKIITNIYKSFPDYVLFIIEAGMNLDGFINSIHSIRYNSDNRPHKIQANRNLTGTH
jgi:hypothetical protein